MTTQGGEVSLVCEGACNPVLPQLDRQVRELRRLVDPGTPMPEDITRMLRKLKHTPHTQLEQSRVFYVCRLCGATRRYGIV